MLAYKQKLGVKNMSIVGKIYPTKLFTLFTPFLFKY